METVNDNTAGSEHHVAALMRWHGLTEEHIPSVTEALNAWDLPGLKVTEQDVRARFNALQGRSETP